MLKLYLSTHTFVMRIVKHYEYHGNTYISIGFDSVKTHEVHSIDTMHAI